VSRDHAGLEFGNRCHLLPQELAAGALDHGEIGKPNVYTGLQKSREEGHRAGQPVYLASYLRTMTISLVRKRTSHGPRSTRSSSAKPSGSAGGLPKGPAVLRGVGAKLAKLGFVNERGAEFSASSIASMVSRVSV
jgi:hypothetical protein